MLLRKMDEPLSVDEKSDVARGCEDELGVWKGMA